MHIRVFAIPIIAVNFIVFAHFRPAAAGSAIAHVRATEQSNNNDVNVQALYYIMYRANTFMDLRLWIRAPRVTFAYFEVRREI